MHTPETPVTPATPEPTEMADAPVANATPAVNTDALVAAARSAVMQSAQAIAEMTLIAGCPERAAEFIAAGKTEAEVRRELIEARARRSEAAPIQSTITPEAGYAGCCPPGSLADRQCRQETRCQGVSHARHYPNQQSR